MSNNGRTRTNSGTDNNKDVSCKIVILGCPGVGKTALTVRFLTKRFIGEYCPTLESEYKYHTQVGDEDVRLEILDTAGQVPDSWKDGYAHWADCFLFVYSITDRQSFNEIIRIKRQIENTRRSTNLVAILVGNKSDLLHDRQVPADEGSELAVEIGYKFYEVSASDWTQVDRITEMFHDLFRNFRKTKITRETKQRKTSSSTRFKQAIQKVISGKTSTKRVTAM